MSERFEAVRGMAWEVGVKEVRVQILLALGFFWLLALVIWPDVLGVVLPIEYIGEPEEQRYFTTLSITAFACGAGALALLAKTARPVTSVILHLLGVALFVELSSAALVYAVSGRSHLPRWVEPFTFHPSVVGLPTPMYRRTSRSGVTVSHNSSGFRGEELEETGGRRIRLLAVGGSTTYGVMVSNADTWTAKLGALLGRDFDVLNLGVPGHSSAEHVILTSLRAADFKPDYVMFYMGWNDVRNSHLKNLKSDYSSFHLLDQYGSLQVELGYRSRLAVLFLLKWALARAGELDQPKHQLRDDEIVPSDRIDERLLSIYERNIKTLIVTTRAIGAVPILVPQVLNRDYQRSSGTWWAPAIPSRDLVAHNEAFNDVMRRTASSLGVRFVASVQTAVWETGDFVDDGHFSGPGNQRFARVLFDDLKDFVSRPSGMVSSVSGATAAEDTRYGLLKRRQGVRAR